MSLSLVRLRAAADPAHVLQATISELQIHVARLEEENQYLRDRLTRIAPRHRSHYSPVERFRILVFVQTYGLSWKEAADRFLISVQTITRWVREATAEPARETIGMLLKAAPPVRRYGDVVRELVAAMDAWGFGGNRRIAQTLARAGVKLGRETVRRWRRAPRRPPPPRSAAVGPQIPVQARRPNDVWLIDLTTVRTLFALQNFRVGVVLDAYARMPLAAGLFADEPTARQVAALVAQAAARVGPPQYLVSDHGPQFTAHAFARTLRRFRIRHRFGAVGSPGAVARIERFWRTLKTLTAVTRRPAFHRADLATRLHAALWYYACFKSHAGLGGATPVEIYVGISPAHHRAQPPTRGDPRGDRAAVLPNFDVAHLDPDRRLPVLIARAVQPVCVRASDTSTRGVSRRHPQPLSLNWG